MRLISKALFITFIFGSNVCFSNELIFICKNDNEIEREFELKINLNKKIINRAGIHYKIVKELENELIAQRSNKVGAVLYEAILTFDRSLGNLKYQGYKTEGTKVERDNANYTCKKRLI